MFRITYESEKGTRVVTFENKPTKHQIMSAALDLWNLNNRSVLTLPPKEPRASSPD